MTEVVHQFTRIIVNNTQQHLFILSHCSNQKVTVQHISNAVDLTRGNNTQFVCRLLYINTLNIQSLIRVSFEIITVETFLRETV